MSEYSQFKKKIQHRAEILEETIRELEQSGLAEGAAARRWRGHLRSVHESLQDPLLKIAVVGSVKSGKSTLMNAMVGEDLLKRGAGVITAFITRVVSDQNACGWVELKPWSQILAEVNAGLRMLPPFAEEGAAGESLDIRSQKDRDRIGFLLDKMKSEWLQSRAGIDPHFLFLERCLQGFDLVGGEIGEETGRREFDRADLFRHQAYVGEESRSVYVRDVELHFPIAWLGDRIEVGDCQGSDSPNPAHFEMLQQYLLASHFIVYVIGSRTGLREADFKLLDLIRTLRMFPQTLFVLNLDFDIHSDRDDVERITDRVRSELGWVVQEPRLFAFSALFHLLKQLGDKSPKFERRHLKLWKDGKTLSKASDAGFTAFRKELESRICAQRSQVLLGCGLSRLEMIAASVLDTARLGRSVLEKSRDSVKDTARQLRSRHIALQSTLQNLADTVAGLSQSLKGKLGARTEEYFDPVSGPIVREALDMVERFPIDLEARKTVSDYRRLIGEYYGFYLEFRRSLSRFLVEKINLRVMEFAKEEELFLREQIRESSQALWAFFDTALADYRRDILGPESEPAASARYAAREPDLHLKVVPPSFSSFLERGNLGRGILFLKFGFGSFPGILAGLRARIRGEAESEEKPGAGLFKNALEMARNEAKSELARAFGDFRETVKTAYLYRLVDEGCIFLLREFRARAEMAQVNFADLLRQSELRGEGRDAAIEAAERARQIASAMIEELENLRRAILAGMEPPGESSSPEEPALPGQDLSPERGGAE